MPISARALGLAAAMILGLAGQALAHAHLKSAAPPSSGTVSAGPSQLDLHFSEGVNLRFTGVEVTGSGGAVVAMGKAALGAGDDTHLVVPFAKPLGAGTYTVAWHALARDGHKTRGSYSFTVKP